MFIDVFRRLCRSFGRRQLHISFVYFVVVGLITAFKSEPAPSIVHSPPHRPQDSWPDAPPSLQCSQLPSDYLDCEFPADCQYGQGVNVNCGPQRHIDCQGPRNFTLKAECKYCWQTENHLCRPVFNCSGSASPSQQFVQTVCWAGNQTICMGKRVFYKKVRCNWTSGYKWSTALILSITLGGFGADRFYLGLWRSGLGKLFSFGGIGVWTIIDVILIGTGYIGPADGSVFMP